MNVGDRVKFNAAGKWFREDCDHGTILERIEDKLFDRPWLVRWDSGAVTRPKAKCLEQLAAVRVEVTQPAEPGK